jgi:hypothetical protein
MQEQHVRLAQFFSEYTQGCRTAREELVRQIQRWQQMPCATLTTPTQEQVQMRASFVEGMNFRVVVFVSWRTSATW